MKLVFSSRVSAQFLISAKHRVTGGPTKGAFTVTISPSRLYHATSSYIFPPIVPGISVKKVMRQCHCETSGRVIKILGEFSGERGRARVKQKAGAGGVLSENEKGKELAAK